MGLRNHYVGSPLRGALVVVGVFLIRFSAPLQMNLIRDYCIASSSLWHQKLADTLLHHKTFSKCRIFMHSRTANFSSKVFHPLAGLSRNLSLVEWQQVADFERIVA